MNHIWTEDTGSGLHYWKLVNKYLLRNQFQVESKGGNQGLLDAVRELVPEKGDRYYAAFDVVYDNMDVVNKYLELNELAAIYPEQIVLLDMICFEYIVLCFQKLIEWTGTAKQDKIRIRDKIMVAVKDHKIEIGLIDDVKTRDYLKGFKHYSTERVIKAVTYELTENDRWSVKGEKMGDCWYMDCCSLDYLKKVRCNVGRRKTGDEKIIEFLMDLATQRLVKVMKE